MKFVAILSLTTVLNGVFSCFKSFYKKYDFIDKTAFFINFCSNLIKYIILYNP